MSRPHHFAFRALVPLVLASAGTAFAQETSDSSDAPTVAAVAPVDAPAIRGVSVEGSIDPPGRIEELVAGVAATGSPFVPAGDADRVGTPIGTVPRIKHVLEVIGYAADIAPVRTTAGVVLQLKLRAYDRLRRVFVTGNGGVRQLDIIGKLSIRPGQKLLPAGAERDGFFATEADHVREFLRAQGYWEAQVKIELYDDGKAPSGITLLVRVDLGPSYPLGPLTITGATALPADDIADGFRHGNWRFAWLLPAPFSRSVLREDIASLVAHYRRIGFPGVRVQDDFNPDTSIDRAAKNVRLNITVRERRHVEVAFEGNHSRSSAALQDSLTLLKHGAYDDVEAAASAAALENSYHDRGFMLVKVTWRRERISEQSDRMVFIIDEGPTLKVRGVSFEGNRSIPSDVLSDRVRTKVYPFLGVLGLGEGGFASLRQVALDVSTLADYYASVGYPEAKARAEIAPSPGLWRPLPSSLEGIDEDVWRNANSLFVRFLIEEGPLVWVAGMEFQCVEPNESMPREDEFFMDSLRTVMGAPYQPALVKSDESRIKRALGDDGYRYAQVEAKTERHADQMHIAWRIKLGPQVHVGPTFVRGNFLTTEKTILTWAELREGDLLTTRREERARRNLALIQLFNNPSPLGFPSATPTDPVVPMLVEVEERHDHWGVIRVGGGASTDQAPPDGSFPYVGIYGALGYEHRNLFGHGWTLTSQAAYGNTLKSVTGSFLNPRFLGTLVRMEILAAYLQQATLRLGDVHSGSGSFGFAREMYPGIDANVRYNLRNTSRTELLARSARQGAFDDQTTARIGTFVSSLSAEVEWHRLDHVLIPARGFKVAAGVEVALPAFFFDVAQDSFVKLYARGLSVVPLLSWLSLRYSIRYDQGIPLGGSDLLPKVERFFAGGDTTIRGYQLDHALTETIAQPMLGSGTSTPIASYVQYRPLGGNLRILQNIDLQFPLSPPFYGSVFFDSGMVGYSLTDVSATDFRHGVGFSPLIVKLPVGDLSLSFAVPLNRHPGDDTWRTHFNVGLMF